MGGLELSIEQETALKTYIKMLLESNQFFNLTSITMEGEIWRKHVIDSLLIFYAVDIPTGASLVDVGTGAGLPGMIIKIMRPDIEVTLLEARGKKVNFLKKVVSQLGMQGIECVWGRAEEVGHDEDFREKFDFAVARGVARLNILAEFCLPLVRVGGTMVAYKGPEGEEELKQGENAVRTLGGGEIRTYRARLQGGWETRQLIVIKKTSSTPTKYPRRPGRPAKKPL